MISNGWRSAATGTEATFAVTGSATPAPITVAAGDDPVELDLSAFDLTLAGCDFTEDDLGTGANDIHWKWVDSGTGTTADGEVGAIADNSHIIPLEGDWDTGETLILDLQLTYNGVTITKTGALTVNFD